MAALARAFKIEEIENDPSLVDGATKDCFDCDLDNPLRVDRATCKTCEGTGQEPLAIAEIVKELKASKRQKPNAVEDYAESRSRTRSKKIKPVDDDDMYLEY